jgi:hypothetical protein
VRLEGLGQLKIYNDLIGNRTRDLPACSIMPGCFKKSSTPLEAYKNLFRGHVQCFELS